MPNYWNNPEVEAAIIEFNSSDDLEIRNRIYEERLHKPFSKMVEYVYNTFKFCYREESLQDTIKDGLGHVVAQLHHFDPKKGKAFGYFSLAAKRYFIITNNKNYLRFSSSLPLFNSREEHEEDPGIELQADDPFYAAKERSEFFSQVIQWWDQNVGMVFRKEFDQQAALTVINSFADIPSGQLRKKDVFPHLRKQLGISAEQQKLLTGIVSKMKPYMKKLIQSYGENGIAECDFIPRKPVQPKEEKEQEPAKPKKPGKPFGERCKQAKLNPEKVQEIREAYNQGLTSTELARKYGVGQPSIWKVLTGVSWKQSLPKDYQKRKGIPCHLMKGENHPHAKLTADQVREILAKRQETGISAAKLAQQYGVSPSAIAWIIYGKGWKSIFEDVTLNQSASMLSQESQLVASPA